MKGGHGTSLRPPLPFLGVTHMNALIFLALAAIAAPPPPAYPDKVTGQYYAGDIQHVPACAITTVGSAETSIYMSSWKLTDTTVSTALAIAATNGISVNIALDLTGGTGTAQHQVARALTAAGCTVYDVAIPRLIANNFIEIDGAYTLKGNYYYSPTATQIGSYLLTISGTATASDAITTFTTLVGAEHILRRATQSKTGPYTCLSYRGLRNENTVRTTDDDRPRTDYSPIPRIPEPPRDAALQTAGGRLASQPPPAKRCCARTSLRTCRWRLRSCLAPPATGRGESVAGLVPRGTGAPGDHRSPPYGRHEYVPHV